MGRVHPCAVSAPQRRHPAGTGGAGHPAPRHGGPPPDRQHRRAVDAGRHGCQRLHRLHPARQLRLPTPSCPSTTTQRSCRPRCTSSSWRVCWKAASTASTAAQRAAASAASTASNAAQAQTAAQRTSADSAAASQLCSPCRGCCRTGRGAGAYRRSGSERERQKRHRKTDGAGCGGASLPCAVPVSGQLLRVLSVDPNTGAVLTDTAAMPDLSPYLRSSTVPTASAPGAVRVDPACGINVRSDGTLITAPAAREPAGQHGRMHRSAADPRPAALWREEGSDHRRSRRGMDRCRKGKLPCAPSVPIFPPIIQRKMSMLCWLGTQLRLRIPVGSIYQSTDPTSPAALFGGSMGADRIRARADGCQQQPRSGHHSKGRSAEHHGLILSRT